ncbi:MAG: four helix bundle protein [Candidatus Marinimicrobia bacterium]|nr:four helix bundle protein [Candidatus Neomarinimicrobiota bacterium]
MSGIDNFTGLKCWQEARTLVNSIYTITKYISFNREYDLVRQLRRAAVSGMTNIA